ncbi:hypothetical protein HFP71_37585 [Streptomyces sp. ARC32]
MHKGSPEIREQALRDLAGMRGSQPPTSTETGIRDGLHNTLSQVPEIRVVPTGNSAAVQIDTEEVSRILDGFGSPVTVAPPLSTAPDTVGSGKDTTVDAPAGLPTTPLPGTGEPSTLDAPSTFSTPDTRNTPDFSHQTNDHIPPPQNTTDPEAQNNNTPTPESQPKNTTTLDNPAHAQEAPQNISKTLSSPTTPTSPVTTDHPGTPAEISDAAADRPVPESSSIVQASPLTILVSQGPPPVDGAPEAAWLLDTAGTDRAVVFGPPSTPDGAERSVRPSVELTREGPDAPVRVRPLTVPPVTTPDSIGGPTGPAGARNAKGPTATANTAFPRDEVLLPLADALGAAPAPSPRPVTQSTEAHDQGDRLPITTDTPGKSPSTPVPPQQGNGAGQNSTPTGMDDDVLLTPETPASPPTLSGDREGNSSYLNSYDPYPSAGSATDLKLQSDHGGEGGTEGQSVFGSGGGHGAGLGPGVTYTPQTNDSEDTNTTDTTDTTDTTLPTNQEEATQPDTTPTQSSPTGPTGPTVKGLTIEPGDAVLKIPSYETGLLEGALTQEYGKPLPDPADLKPGGKLIIIGHGHQLGDGQKAATEIQNFYGNTLPAGTHIHMIVCQAGAGAYPPAQRLADKLNTPVVASTIDVTMNNLFDEEHYMDVEHDDPYAHGLHRGLNTTHTTLHGNFFPYTPQTTTSENTSDTDTTLPTNQEEATQPDTTPTQSSPTGPTGPTVKGLTIEPGDAVLKIPSYETGLLEGALTQEYGKPLPDPADLKPGGKLIIIGHGHQLGDGQKAATEIQNFYGNTLPAGTHIHMIVCQAGAGAYPPAQRLADKLNTPVVASTIDVTMNNLFDEEHYMDVEHDDPYAHGLHRGLNTTHTTLHGNFFPYTPQTTTSENTSDTDTTLPQTRKKQPSQTPPHPKQPHRPHRPHRQGPHHRTGRRSTQNPLLRNRPPRRSTHTGIRQTPPRPRRPKARRQTHHHRPRPPTRRRTKSSHRNPKLLRQHPPRRNPHPHDRLPSRRRRIPTRPTPRRQTQHPRRRIHHRRHHEQPLRRRALHGRRTRRPLRPRPPPRPQHHPHHTPRQLLPLHTTNHHQRKHLRHRHHPPHKPR